MMLHVAPDSYFCVKLENVTHTVCLLAVRLGSEELWSVGGITSFPACFNENGACNKAIYPGIYTTVISRE